MKIYLFTILSSLTLVSCANRDASVTPMKNNYFLVTAYGATEDTAVNTALNEASSFCYPFNLYRKSLKFQGSLSAQSNQSLSPLQQAINQDPEEYKLDPNRNFIAKLTIQCL